jgi:deazaflavin-dependent oxidoreductase (nitroreductase family)
MRIDLDDGSYAITASAAGADKSPGWYHNLRAHPDTTIELDGKILSVRARITEGEERDRLYARFEALSPRFTGYKNKTQRTIPVVVLEPHTATN